MIVGSATVSHEVFFCVDLLSELHHKKREAVQLLRLHYINRLAPMEEVKNEKSNGGKNDPI